MIKNIVHEMWHATRGHSLIDGKRKGITKRWHFGALSGDSTEGSSTDRLDCYNSSSYEGWTLTLRSTPSEQRLLRLTLAIVRGSQNMDIEGGQ